MTVVAPTMLDFLPPAAVLILAAALIGLLKGAWRTAVLFLAPAITLWLVWQVPDGPNVTVPRVRTRFDEFQDDDVPLPLARHNCSQPQPISQSWLV